MHTYYVYIMASPNNNVLYIGVTNELQRRVSEHQNHQGASFTKKYNCVKLVHFESFNDIKTAIAREKNLKAWKRAWKDNLIHQNNPNMDDISNTL